MTVKSFGPWKSEGVHEKKLATSLARMAGVKVAPFGSPEAERTRVLVGSESVALTEKAILEPGFATSAVCGTFTLGIGSTMMVIVADCLMCPLTPSIVAV